MAQNGEHQFSKVATKTAQSKLVDVPWRSESQQDSWLDGSLLDRFSAFPTHGNS
jgi:hypothetical protein